VSRAAPAPGSEPAEAWRAWRGASPSSSSTSWVTTRGLQIELQSVHTDEEPGLLDQRALGRALHEHRIRVVDVGEDAMPARKLPELIEAAVRARDREVVHLPGCPVADAERDQLVVGPEGAVEEQQIGLGEALEKRCIQVAAGWHEGALAVACLVPQDHAHSVPDVMAPCEPRGPRGDGK